MPVLFYPSLLIYLECDDLSPGISLPLFALCSFFSRNAFILHIWSIFDFSALGHLLFSLVQRLYPWYFPSDQNLVYVKLYSLSTIRNLRCSFKSSKF